MKMSLRVHIISNTRENQSATPCRWYLEGFGRRRRQLFRKSSNFIRKFQWTIVKIKLGTSNFSSVAHFRNMRPLLLAKTLQKISPAAHNKPLLRHFPQTTKILSKTKVSFIFLSFSSEKKCVFCSVGG